MVTKRLAQLGLILLLAMTALSVSAAKLELKYTGKNHQGAIRDVAVDESRGRVFSTGDDGLIKLWDLETGAFKRNLFLPNLGPSHAALNAIDVHPTGLIAIGGSFSSTAQQYKVFLMNENLALKSSPLVASQVITHIAFEHQEKVPSYVVVGTTSGVEIFDLVSRQRTAMLNLDAQVTGISAAPNSNWLVTDTLGRISLITQKAEIVSSVQSGFSKGIGSIAISPNKLRFAVSAIEEPKIHIYNTIDLSKSVPLNMAKIDHGDLASLAWNSKDELFASGSFGIGANTAMIKWYGEGFERRQLATLDRRRTAKLIHLSGGEILFATQRPSLGLFSTSGEISYLKRSALPNGRYDQLDISDSDDSNTITLKSAKNQLVLNLNTLALQTKPNKQELKVLDKKLPEAANGAFQINGKLHRLALGERLTDMLETAKLTYLSSDFGLRAITNDGAELFARRTKATIWSMQYSQKWDRLFTLQNDGIIRIYDGQSGRHQVNILIDTQTQEWVAHSIEGEFVSSATAGDMLSWVESAQWGQLANGFNIKQYRTKYYDPNLIAKRITQTFKEPITQVAEEIPTQKKQTKKQATPSQVPPRLEILSHASEAIFKGNEVTVGYRIVSEHPVDQVRVLINGRPASDNRGLSRNKNTKVMLESSVTVNLPSEDATVSLVAISNNVASEPATVYFSWKGKPQEQLLKPNLYVLAIGVSDYDIDDYDLNFASKDASDLVKTVEKQHGKLYKAVNVNALPDASRDQVLNGLDWLDDQVTSRDVAMIFIAGHGVNDNTGDYYFLPANANIENLKRTAVPYYEIRKTLNNLPGKTILFADTCHSGNIMGGSKRRAIGDINRVVMDLTSAENGVVVFASSTGRQYSLENPSWGNGAFTKALIEGINGKADLFGKGVITINTLDAYVAERVKALTRNQQTPTTSKPQTISDFPLAAL